MFDQQLLQTIRNFIIKGQLGDALNQLIEFTATQPSNIHNELIILSAKYRSLEKMELDNRISFENYQKGNNQLIRSLITIVDKFEEQLSTKADMPRDTIAIEEIYKKSIARTKVLEVMLKTDKGLTIKEIYQQSGLRQRKFIIAALDELIAEGMVERYKENGASLNRFFEGQRLKAQKWI